MAELCRIENPHDIIFFCREWSDLDKISQTGAERHVDCGDMAEMETRSGISIAEKEPISSLPAHTA